MISHNNPTKAIGGRLISRKLISPAVPTIRISVPIHLTEDREKVVRAVVNVFPDLMVRLENGTLKGEGSSIDRLKELLAQQRIRNTARKVFIRSLVGNRCAFELNKQAAFMNRVSFGERSPLGNISVSIEDASIMQLIDEMAPNMERTEVEK